MTNRIDIEIRINCTDARNVAQAMQAAHKLVDAVREIDGSADVDRPSPTA